MSSGEYEEQKVTTLSDIIVFGVANRRVKERLLRQSGITLDKALDICYAPAASKVQMKGENQQSHDVNFLRKNKSVNRGKSHRQRKQAARGQHCGT